MSHPPPHHHEEEKKTEHQVKENLSYHVHYPPHPPREESAEYRRTHHQLCIAADMPCLICHRRHSEGISTETHHFFVEWAAAGAIDWLEFGRKAKHFHNLQTGKNIGTAFDWSEVAKNPTLFVDSPENMVVLCEEHHRSSPFGIHHSTSPNGFCRRMRRKVSTSFPSSDSWEKVAAKNIKTKQN